MVHRLPFDETYAPTNNLVFGRNLGGIFLQLTFFAVIAKLAVLYLEKSAKEQGLHYL
jgi:hypothetical protein